MVALLVLIPGVDETLRINGNAQITDDTRLLAGSTVRGRPPSIGLIIAVREAFLHCPKAFVRSDLWNPKKQVNRSALPAYKIMLSDHVAGLTEKESKRQADIMNKRGLY